jgi:hypothetical protein
VSKESGIGKDIILAKLSPKEDNSPKSENYTKALMMLEKNSGND